MQTFVGIILGVFLTIGVAFLYDSSTGRAVNGLAAGSTDGHAPIVNWDVVRVGWGSVKLRLQEGTVDVEKGWKRIAASSSRRDIK
jgi:hypothetical protein